MTRQWVGSLRGEAEAGPAGMRQERRAARGAIALTVSCQTAGPLSASVSIKELYERGEEPY